MKSFPEILQTKNNFKLLNSEAKSLRAPSAEEWENNLRPRLAGHCLFYARTNEVIFEKYPKRAHVLVSFDLNTIFCFGRAIQCQRDLLLR